jgi:hypothetical protein
MRYRRPLILAAVVAAAAVLVAGCGGGSSPGVANLGSSTSTSSSSPSGNPTQTQIQQAQRDMVRFVDCMRSHGLPNLPNPAVAPRAFKNAMANQSSGAQSAYTACAHLQPGGGPPNQSTATSQAQTAALLAFARCLRSHGFPSFPDPTSSGQLTHEMLAQARIDLHEPAVVQAADRCTSVTHGVITKAVVARFVAGH